MKFNHPLDIRLSTQMSQSCSNYGDMACNSTYCMPSLTSDFGAHFGAHLKNIIL